MADDSIPRCTFLPPAGRPRWQPRDPAGWELLYLSWGARWMGAHPIPLARHEGWVYAVVFEGAPTLLVQGQTRRTRPGDVFIFHPDCAYGWSDQLKRVSRLMTWLWRGPPAHSRLQPVPGGWIHLRLNERTRRRLVTINRQCQRDVTLASETSALALRRAHLDLDLCLAGALRRPETANPRCRMHMAMHFLRQNPALQHPAQKLCEYLQIAPSTLRELFHTYRGQSPRDTALELRMRLARRYLRAANTSVKQVAYELGYRHPNDFSRAYKRHYGEPAVRRAKK